MNNNLVTFKKRHEYYTGIYDDLHPFNNKEERIYTRPKQNFEFQYKNDELVYSRKKELEFSRRSLDNFKTFTEKDLNPDKRTVQNKISYYLSNNLVPVCLDIFINRDVVIIHMMNSKKKKGFVHLS